MKLLNKFSDNLNGKPFVVMRYSAQNGFGGNNTEIAAFAYGDTENKYYLFGSCESLNIDEVDENDKSTCNLINIFMNNFSVVGEVDINRIDKIIKENTYSSVKIVQ